MLLRCIPSISHVELTLHPEYSCGAEILRSAQDDNDARLQEQPYRSMYTMLGVLYTARVRSDQKAIEGTQG